MNIPNVAIITSQTYTYLHMPEHGSLKHGLKYVSYAQNFEDIKLFGYFHLLTEPGFYVDVGANHELHDSVTKFFYIRGWRGINIEPQAELKQILDEQRPEDINIAVGISDKPGKLKFRKYDSDGLSTFSTTLHKSYETGYQAAAVSYKELTLKLETLAYVLGKNLKNKDIHFLKVDVEGFEYNVLKGNNWKKYRPWVVCVESTGADKRWQQILEKEGYIRHLFDGLNDYYVANEHSDLIDSYHAIVASEVIRYDVAGLPEMRLTQKIRNIKNLVKK